jgi:hypothetical protein
MRNGKRGRKKTRRKTKLIYGMASTEGSKSPGMFVEA